MLGRNSSLSASSGSLRLSSPQVLHTVFVYAHNQPSQHNPANEHYLGIANQFSIGCLKSHARVPLTVEMKVIVAKPGLDGHDRGAKVIARALRDGGHEVVYTGLRKTPEEIVRATMDEDAAALGLSTLSGAHDVLIPAICEGLIKEDLGRTVVFAGGIIPASDRDALHNLGVRAIFGPGTSTSEILDFLNEVSSRKKSGESVGVGESSEWRWE